MSAQSSPVLEQEVLLYRNTKNDATLGVFCFGGGAFIVTSVY